MIDINKLYDNNYYATRMDWKPDVYPIISKAIIDFFNPKTLIDVGCGNGVLLDGLRGIEATGVDGSYQAVKICRKNRLTAWVQDLRIPVNQGERFDIAVSIEVAEHIEEEFTNAFLDNLCRFSDTIIMTASPEQDGGKYHFNVQGKGYWTGKMNERSFNQISHIRFMERLWDNIPTERDYLWKNMMIFKKQGT